MIQTIGELKLVVPRMVWRFFDGEENAREVANDLFEGLSVGDMFCCEYAAPGCGHVTYKIVSIDGEGAWGRVVEDSGYILTPEEVI